MLVAALAGCASLPGPTYTNPVIDRDFPDPALLRAADGWTYAYATQGHAAGRVFNVQVARSRNLVEWEHLGDALPDKPRWARTKQVFWAPHVVHDPERGRYVMYYAAEPDAAGGRCLAVAVAPRPQGPFADAGPLQCDVGIQHIDPMAFDDPRSGRRFLYWGSGRGPIRVQELAPDRLGFALGSVPHDLLHPQPGRPYRSLIEGAWVVYREGWYYLFYSGDRCCSRDPRYAVMVARARDPRGPFESREEPILVASRNWAAPGHVGIVEDDRGVLWMAFHAARPGGEWAPRVMLIERLQFHDGWPRVEGDAPSTGNQRAPVIGPQAAPQVRSSAPR